MTNVPNPILQVVLQSNDPTQGSWMGTIAYWIWSIVLGGAVAYGLVKLVGILSG